MASPIPSPTASTGYTSDSISSPTPSPSPSSSSANTFLFSSEDRTPLSSPLSISSDNGTDQKVTGAFAFVLGGHPTVRQPLQRLPAAAGAAAVQQAIGPLPASSENNSPRSPSSVSSHASDD